MKRVGLLLTFLWLLLPLGSWAGWVTELPEGENAFGYWTSLVLDSQGQPNIVYRDSSGGGRLRYVVQSTAGWVGQTIEGGFDSAGGYASIDLTGTDAPVVSYFKSGVGLRLARWEGSTWTYRTVDPSGGQYTSMKIDSSGTVHISYFAQNSLKYARCDGVSCSTQTLDSGGIVGLWTSLALDSQGLPSIAYYDSTRRDLKLAVKFDIAFTTQTVTESGDVGKYASLKIDKDDNPAISFVKDNTLMFANRTSAGWQFKTVDASASAYSSMSLDAKGRVFIAYEAGGAQLNLAIRQTSGQWTTETIEPTNGRYPSFALAENGTRHVAFGYSNFYYSKFDVLTSPANLKGLAPMANKIRWNWNDTALEESGFRVYRSTDLVQISENLPANTEQWEQDVSTPNTPSQIVVGAFNSFGERSSSTSPIVYSLANPPGAASINSFGMTSATVSWLTNGNPVGTLYRLEKSTDGQAFGLVTTSSRTTAWVDGLKSESTTYFRVRAENGNAIPTAFNEMISVYLSPVLPPQAPGAIYGTARSSTSITWNWSDSSAWETGYSVLRSSGLSLLSPELPADTTEWIEVGLSPNSPSQIVVRATNTFGFNDSLPGPLRYSFAVPPADVSVTLSSTTSAEVHWSANGNPEWTHYKVEKSFDGSIFSGVMTGTSTVVLLGGLADGTTNYIRVQALNGNDMATDYTQPLPLYVPSATPPTPPGQPHVVSRSSSTLTWEWVDNSNYETGFIVLRASDEVPLSNTLPPDTVRWTQQDLAPNSSSQILIQAKNLSGNSRSIPSAISYSLAVPPIGLAVSSVSWPTARLEWNANSNVDGTKYRVEKSPNGYVFSLLSLSTSTFIYTDQLTDGTTNFFRVRAENGDGIETTYDTSSFYFPTVEPPVITGAPSFVDVTTHSITWRWGETLREDGVRIMGATGSSLSGNLPADTVEWVQSELTPNTSSQIVVKAFNLFGESDSLASPVVYSLASPPMNTQANDGTNGSLILSWNGNGNPTGTRYELERSLDGSSFVDLGETTDLRFETFDVLDGSTNYFRVRAKNGNGVLTGYDSVVPKFLLPASAPPPPANLVVSDRSETSLTWKWTDNSHNETGFRVLRDSDSFNLASLPANTTSWVQTGVTPNSLARVQVEAFNGLGSARTQRSYLNGQEYSLAEAPLGTVISNVTPTSVTLQWAASGNPPGTLYRGYISLDNVTFNPFSEGTDPLTLTANGLISGQSYFFRVDSINKGLVANPGSVVSAVIPYGPPPLPPFSRSESVRTPSGVRWKWGSVANALGYRILRSSDGVNLSGDLPADILEWSHGGLVPNQETAVWIESFNAYGASSTLASVITPPLPPGDVHVDRVLPLQLTLGWANNGNALGSQYLPEISSDNVHFQGFPNYVSGFTSTITNLEEDTSYYLRVQTIPFDPELPSAISMVILTRPLQTIPPSPPVKTRIAEVYMSSVTLTWIGADSLFESEISTDNVNFEVFRPAGIEKSATAKSLVPDTTFYFRVRALNMERKKYSSYDVTVSTFLQAMPYAPVVMDPVRNMGAITWRWQSVSNAMGYRVIRSADKANLSGDLLPGTTYWVQTAIGPSQQISVEIESFNSYGVADSAVSALSLPNAPAQTKVVNVTSTTITLAWDANGNGDGTRYCIDVSTLAGEYPNDSLTTSERSILIQDLLADATYFFRVRARNDDDVDGYSAYDVVVSTLYRTPPPAMVGAPVADAVGNEEITWTWTDSLDGVTGYHVIRVGDGKDLSGLLHAGQHSWTQKGLSPNAPVQTMIRAEGTFGVKESLAGAVVYTIPNRPRDTHLTGFSYGKASIAWNTNGNPNWTTYAVYYSSGAWDPIVSTQVTGGSSTVADLSPKTSYVLSVRAVGPGGASPFDQSVSVLTTSDPIRFDLANPDWLISTVDSHPGAGEYATLVLDSKGIPRIVYRAGENLTLARLGTHGWALETVAPEAHVGSAISVLVDSQGQTHAAYFNRFDRSLNYTTNNGGIWSTLVVPHDTISGAGWAYSVQGQGFQGTSLQRTSDGIPVVAYTSHIAASETEGRMDHGTYMVFETRRIADTWEKSLVASFPTVTTESGPSSGMGEARLALDSKGNSHVVFFHSTGPASALYYASREGGIWKTETIEVGVAGNNTTMAIQMGVDDRLHVLYSDTSHQRVRYAVRVNAHWSIETVEEGKPFAFLNLTLDVRGAPHVAFSDLDSGILRYAHRKGAGWAVQTVDDKGKTGWYPSIAVDADDNVHLAYYDFTNKVLKYAALVSRRMVAQGKMPREGGWLEFAGSRGPIRINVPAGAFLQDVTLSVRSPDLMVLPTAQKRDLTPLGVGLEISATPAVRPLRAMTVSFPYDEADLLPGKHESRLTLAKYDESAGEWVPVPTQVDTTNNRLTSFINEFTVYQVMWMGMSPSVSEARVYPNPFRPGHAGHDKIVFDDIPTGAQVKIYNVTGEFVQQLSEDGTGRAKWDARNSNGDSIASGVYFVRITGEGGSKILKVAVQR